MSLSLGAFLPLLATDSPLLNPQASSNKVSKNEQDLKEFADALEEHRAKGSEEQEMARKVQKSKRKATKGKARRESIPLALLSAELMLMLVLPRYSPSQGRFREPSFVAREVIQPSTDDSIPPSLVLLPRPPSIPSRCCVIPIYSRYLQPRVSESRLARGREERKRRALGSFG